ncbi:hypothetical protein KIMH_01140 [Bombiscardovia apis]|uniref:Nucleotidyl transferase AbiEii/AbiGii toxin family protein n=1 Tax=Bombiscardovia apis TaxID=2932182 RepID=A0ABN6SFI0_9BIFI|nr:nucleotidyl transferase AbiEii/AbiGii toxin family protein [Bombiscardovia apis]BDR54003.1 hypothetical protein KIMH_01140 [Bombiscardovia apis]
MCAHNIDAHKAVIEHMLRSLNAPAPEGNPFILKGGTALMECYGLDRFSEDIDLDCERAKVSGKRFVQAIEQACHIAGFAYRVGKDTPTVQRVFVDYGNPQRPLKVELSHRRKVVDVDVIAVVSGIKTYTISELCEQKCAAYMSRDKIRDLFDLTFIAEQHWAQLNQSARTMLQRAFEYKDIRQLDYLLETQSDPLIDAQQLEDRFLQTMDKVGLLTVPEDAEPEL